MKKTPIVRKTPLRRTGGLQRRTRINQRGKRWVEWEKARRILKVAFEKAGITQCEKCGSPFALSFAHSKARRCIPPGSDLIYEVSLLCFMTSDYCPEMSCHAQADSKGEHHRTKFITDIISLRETPVVLPI